MASQVILNEEEECFAWANSIENVGCMDADMGCGDAITYAESPMHRANAMALPVPASPTAGVIARWGPILIVTKTRGL